MRPPLVSMAFLIVGMTAISAVSRGRLPPWPEFQGWITYFRAPESVQNLQRTQEALQEVSIFAMQFDHTGAVIPATPWVTDTLYQIATSTTRPASIWLTMVNDVKSPNGDRLKDPQIVHDRLANPAVRARHIEELLAKMGPADGLDIDFENLRKDDGEFFCIFVEELAKKLHAANKKLSVTLEPKTTLVPGNAGRAIDWKRVGESADQVRIMAYFYYAPQGRPGPIAPLAWLSELSRFALQRIPVEKLVFILTVNGQDWPAGGRPKGVRFSEALALSTGWQVERDTESQTPYFSYQRGPEKHQIWYEDVVSLKAKIQRLQEEGIQKIGFWQLGTGDPAFWDWLTQETLKQKQAATPNPQMN